MYTINETMEEIRNLGGWGKLIEIVSTDKVYVFIWEELVVNKHGNQPWKTAYIVRHWIDGEWQDTRYFKTLGGAYQHSQEILISA